MSGHQDKLLKELFGHSGADTFQAYALGICLVIVASIIFPDYSGWFIAGILGVGAFLLIRYVRNDLKSGH